MKILKGRQVSFLSGLSLLPIIGALFTIMVVLNSKRKDFYYWFSIISLFLVNSFLIYENVKNKEAYHQLGIGLSQMMLDDLVRDIELYKIITSSYPDSLLEFRKGEVSFDSAIKLNSKKRDYFYKKIDEKSYVLFSVGPDGALNTEDDVFPSIELMKTPNLGIRKPTR